MKKIAALAALALVSSLALPAVTAGAGPTIVETPTVSITVSMDLPDDVDSDGPVVFEVDDVPIGDGPELSGDDLVSNPSNWRGSLFVDVDLETSLITITADDPGDFQTADVTIEGDTIDLITLVSDDLWETDGTDEEPLPLNGDIPSAPSELVEMILSYGNPIDGVAAIGWESSAFDFSLDMNSEGAAVFSFQPLEPTTTTTAAPTTTTTAAAAPAAVTPRFTG